MLYSVGNLITASALVSVASEDSVFVKENLYNARQSKPYRTTAKTSQYVVLNFGTDRPTILGILNHNLTNAATIKLQANSSDSWGSPPYDQTITWRELNIYFTFSQDYPYWRVTIDDSGNSAFPQIGELVLGTYSTFTKDFIYPYGESKHYQRTEQVTPYGQRWRTRKSILKSFNLDFGLITDSELSSEIETFFDAIDGIDPFIFVPDTTDYLAWYVYALNDFEARRIWLNNNSFNLQLEEQARGITLL